MRSANQPRSALALVIGVVLACAEARSAEPKPLKVFVLAGQSNMVGQGVVDLAGKDHNDGKGTLATLLGDPAKSDRLKHLQDPAGQWRVRDDVWVRFQPEGAALRAGPLAVGYTRYDGKHHFGPELQFGHVLGDFLENEVLIIKTAWGGKSLYADFRPPSSGGTTGPYYTLMIEQIREALANIKRDFPQSKAEGYELAGLVWYQGWNDGCDTKHAVPEYERNLVNLIRDVRKDLGVPNLPVVVGELTGPWVDAPKEWEELRRAQAAAAAHPDFRGNVAFVPTRHFVRAPEDSPNPGHGHHEFGNAETYFLVGDALGKGMVDLLRPTRVGSTPPDSADAMQPLSPPKRGEMAGYLLVPAERVPAEFNAGFSLYAAAWPLLERYPGRRFQSGLFGTWMHAQLEEKPPLDLYSDIEGGLGWWRDTRFATETPKFIMGGVAVNFTEIANGPSHGLGTWEDPKGLYGVAQLSPWLLFPIDGLNIRQGTCGELFGYGYLPLPIIAPKPTTAGKDIPTGGNCWTLFLNTANFKGPVCFFTPYFWSRSAVVEPRFSGLLLDSRPSDPNKAFQMETQYVPAVLGTDSEGRTYARVAPTQFPVGPDGRTIVLHRLTSYSKAALWDGVEAWFNGGRPVSGEINPAWQHVQHFLPRGGSTWKIYAYGTPGDKEPSLAWNSFARPISPDPTTYGYEWDEQVVTRIPYAGHEAVRLAEFYRLDKGDKQPRWSVVRPDDVPAEVGLMGFRFDRPHEEPSRPYETPAATESCWKRPGPAAGPFTARLGDGSVVTYYWYRFADQPALLNADLSPEDRESIQARVELLHRHWTIDRDYLAPPTVGRLAELDPALIVQPPRGLEIGYVPIATRQELPSEPDFGR
ncbi:MAG: sialate O-acetylesterase [Phycisphaerales bacterium]